MLRLVNALKFEHISLYIQIIQKPYRLMFCSPKCATKKWLKLHDINGPC